MTSKAGRVRSRALAACIAGLFVLAFASPALAAPGDGSEKSQSQASSQDDHGKGKANGHDEKSDDSATAEDAADSGASQSDENGSGSTATSGPGNSEQGCDGSHNSDTGHGANHSGPYDNTCDGSPSGNGNGTGQATGKPCAGCVGNADDKNPKGQYPNGSDHNKGYECDENHGIGRTNPAHTGCRPETPPACTEDCTPPPDCTEDCTPPPPCTGGDMHGDCSHHHKPPAVENRHHRRPRNDRRPPVVLGSRIERQPAPAQPGALLPFTGASVLPLLFAAIVMIVSGTALTIRRQSH